MMVYILLVRMMFQFFVVQYINELDNKVDAIVFSGGIGENNKDVDKYAESLLFAASRVQHVWIVTSFTQAIYKPSSCLISKFASLVLDVPVVLKSCIPNQCL